MQREGQLFPQHTGSRQHKAKDPTARGTGAALLLTFPSSIVFKDESEGKSFAVLFGAACFLWPKERGVHEHIFLTNFPKQVTQPATLFFPQAESWADSDQEAGEEKSEGL